MERDWWTQALPAPSLVEAELGSQGSPRLGNSAPKGRQEWKTCKLSPCWGDKVTGLVWFGGCRRKGDLVFITCLRSLVSPGAQTQGTFQTLAAWRQKSMGWGGRFPCGGGAGRALEGMGCLSPRPSRATGRGRGGLTFKPGRHPLFPVKSCPETPSPVTRGP